MTYEEFTERNAIGPHLLLAATFERADAMAVLRRRLADRTALRAPTEWIALVALLAAEDRTFESTARDLLSELLVSVTDKPLDEDRHRLLAHATVRALMAGNRATLIDHASIERFVRWFVDTGGPGDAALAADLIRWCVQGEETPGTPLETLSECWPHAIIMPLAAWLFSRGAAELRASRREPLPALLLQLALLLDQTLVPVALRFILTSDRPTSLLRDAFRLVSEETFWSALERHLEAGCGFSLAAEMLLVRSAHRPGRQMQMLVHPLDGSAEFPLCRGALLRALVRGDVDRPAKAESKVLRPPTVRPRRMVATIQDALAPWAWSVAVQSIFPANLGLTFTDVEALDDALEGLIRCDNEMTGGVRAPGDENREGAIQAWTEFFVAEFVRVHDLCGGGPGVEGQGAVLERFVHHPTDAERRSRRCAAVANALSARLAQDPTMSASTASAILSNRPTTHLPQWVVAALRSLPRNVPRIHSLERDAEREEMRRHLAGIVDLPWHEHVDGLDVRTLFGTGRRIEFGELDGAEISIEGETIWCAARSYESVFAMGERDRRLATGALFFIHEVVHHRQGIGNVRSVQRVRAAGSETMLMHMDLAADHAAARIVHSARPAWSLVYLKGHQCDSLSAYPVGPTHATASRLRKANRLVGLRLDYLVRAEKLLSIADDEGYMFAEYGPGGGAFLLFLSGPPMRILGTCDLSSEDAQRLAESADPSRGTGRGMVELDELLRGLVAGCAQ